MANIDSKTPTSIERQTALADILQHISGRGAQFMMYASALGAIALIPSAQAPLEFMAASLGVNLLSTIIDRVAQGEKIADEKLQREVATAIQNSKLDQLLTKDDFSRALSKLLHNQDKILATNKGNEHELRQLSEQMTELMQLLNDQLSSLYKIQFDDSITEDAKDREFQEEVKNILDMMGYTIEDEQIVGLTSDISATFIAAQEGDFDSVRTLFQCNRGFVDERAVSDFHNGIYRSNRDRLNLSFGIIVTNIYLASSIRTFASQYQIKILTYEDLIDTVFKPNRYLRTACKDYCETNKLFHTYVEIKYLRRGKGKFKDNQTTRQEFAVTEAVDGSSFEAKGDLTPYVDSWLLRDGKSQICLLGEYGTGKTSFAMHYFYKCALAYLENPLKNRIPLLVTLNRYHKSADIEQMMTDFLVNECGIRRDFDTFLKLAARGKLLIVLDGFDEMAKQVDVNARRHNFREIARLLVGNNKVILSGRPNYFLTQAEIDEVFSQESHAADPYKAAIKKAISSSTPHYEILTITLFDRWQIEEFLKKQSEYLKEKGIDDWRELQKTIYGTYNLEELARTPVLLEIIIKTISEIRGKVSHINAARLYQIYTDFWLDREYDEKGDVRWLLTRKDKELFVLDLAWTMLIADNLHPEIHFSQLSERVRNYFGLEKASDIEYFSSDIRFCSYLIHSEADGNYKFIHKSFMEYFSARYIYNALFEERNLSKIVTDRTVTDEVFFFLCQMIGIHEIELLWEFSRRERNEQSKGFLISLTARILQQSAHLNERRGAIQPAEEWTDRLLQYSNEFGFDTGKLWGLITRGKLKAQLGQYSEAEACYAEALSTSRKLGDKPSESQSLIQLGTIFQARGDLDGALEYYQHALAIFEEIDDKASISRILINVGTVCQTRGDLDRALEYYQHALAIFEEIDDRMSVGQTLTNFSEVYQIRGEVDKSLQYSQQALAIFREIGDRRSERQAISRIGDVYVQTGRYEEAERIYKESLTIAQEAGDRQGVSRALSQIGYICMSMARYVEAEKYYQEALAISDALGDQQGVGNALTNMAHIYQRMARYDEALSLYQKSITVSENLGDIHAVGVSLYNLANVYAAQSKFSNSDGLYKKALDIFEKIGDLRSIGRVMHQLGMLSQKAGDFGQAESLYRAALETNEKIGDVIGVLNALESLGDLAEAQQNFAEAERLYMSSLENSLKIGDRRNECDLSIKLGKLAKRAGDKKKAIEYYARYMKLAREMNLSLLSDVVQEYDQLRAKELNPYIVGRPIYDEFFYGRNKELNELYNHIQKQQNVMLVAERRMGKTSLLMRLNQRLELPFISVFVDLQGFPGQAEVLLSGVIRGVVKALLKREILSPERWEKYSLTYARDFVKALESIIDEAKQKLKDIKIVLILDEAERLLELGSQVMGILRATLISNREVVAIIAGTSQLVKMPEDIFNSPLFNIFTVLSLKPLSREDTESLITEPSKQAGVRYESDALKRIFELSGGIPFYVQAIGYQLIELANQESKETIDVEDVNKIIPEIFERLSNAFQWSLHQLGDKERTILATIASGEPLKDAHKQDIRDLENRQLIFEEKGSYRFVSQLLEEWFIQYASSN
jgi:tetratricopeptide (TPR) repeat protein